MDTERSGSAPKGAVAAEPVQMSTLAGSEDYRVSGLSGERLRVLLESDGGTVHHVEASATTTATDVGELSPREIEIIRLIASGRNNTQVAAEIFLSINTVKSYIRAAYRKMGVTTRSQAVLWAVAHGLDRPGSAEPLVGDAEA